MIDAVTLLVATLGILYVAFRARMLDDSVAWFEDIDKRPPEAKDRQGAAKPFAVRPDQRRF